MSTPRALKIRLYLDHLVTLAPRFAALSAMRKRVTEAIDSGSDVSQIEYLKTLGRIVASAPRDFALACGMRRRLADMGIVGHAILSCRDLAQALEIWMQFSDLSGDPFRYESSIDDDLWTVEFHPLPILSPTLAQFCSEEWAASMVKFTGEAAGLDCRDWSIDFQHSKCAEVSYDKYLPAAVNFNRPICRLAIPRSALAVQIHSSDSEMLDLLLEHFANRSTGEAATGIAAQTRHLFVKSAGATPSLTDAAHALGLSKRTLARRLADEGTSYGELLSKFRCEYAAALLTEGTLTAKQIAHTVGFKNHQSLRRAFRNWKGSPLGQWKKAPP